MYAKNARFIAKDCARWHRLQWLCWALLLGLCSELATAQQCLVETIAVSNRRAVAVDNASVVREWGQAHVELAHNTPANIVKAQTASVTLALDASGQIWAWGGSGHYQPELGSLAATGATTTAQRLRDESGQPWFAMQDLALDYNHALAVDNAGQVLAWGRNSRGQLGRGSNVDDAQAAVVTRRDGTRLIGIEKVYAVAGRSFALANDGRVWAWGDNSSGALGVGVIAHQSRPLLVREEGGNELTGITELAVANGAVVALDDQSRLWAWGSNQTGELGRGNYDSEPHPSARPVLRTAGSQLAQIASVAAGGSTILAVEHSGAVLQWGGGVLLPEKVTHENATAISNITAVASNGQSHYAIDNAGGLWYWGMGEGMRGVFGDSNTLVRHPVESRCESNPVFLAPTDRHISDLPQRFSWSANGSRALQATDWQLLLGSTAGGSSDYYASEWLGSTTSVAVAGLPAANNQTVYAMLRARVSGVWYEFSASFFTGYNKPFLTSDSELNSTETFGWTGNGLSVRDYWLQIGTVAGGNDLYDSGVLGSITRHAVADLPQTGENVFVRLNYRLFDTADWSYVDDTRFYLRASGPCEGENTTTLYADGFETGNGAGWRLHNQQGSGNWQVSNGFSSSGSYKLKAESRIAANSDTSYEMTSDVTLGENSVLEFRHLFFIVKDAALLEYSTDSGASWHDANWLTSQHGYTGDAAVGNTAGYVGSHTAYRTTRLNLAPLAGESVRFRYRLVAIDSGYHFWVIDDIKVLDCTVIAAEPQFEVPLAQSTLSATDVSFHWSAGGANISHWWLHMGSAQGRSDYANTGNLGAQSSANVSGLPSDGRLIHARLWFRQPGIAGWQFVDTSFRAHTQVISRAPDVYAPELGSVLSGASETFSWQDNGTAVTAWWIYVGSRLGAADYFDSGNLAADTSITLTGLPVDGSSVSVRLWYRTDDGKWGYHDQTYLAATEHSPVPTFIDLPTGSVLASDGQTIRWSSNGMVVRNWWLYLGTAVGEQDLFDSAGLATSESVVVPVLPRNGATIYARLWYRDSLDHWHFLDDSFVAQAAVPTLTIPHADSTIGAGAIHFGWSANGLDVKDWWLYVGSTHGANQYHDSGMLSALTGLAVDLQLPATTAPVHVRLWYRQTGESTWRYIDRQYQRTAAE